MLAGGRGSRLGGDKAAVILGGRPLLAWTLDALLTVTRERVVVAKKHSPLPECHVPVWRESAPDFHPRHGLVRALEGARGRPVLVVPVDMPLVPPALLGALLDRVAGGAIVAMPRADGRLHPLCAAFSPAALRPLRAAPPDEPLTRTLEGLGADVLDAETVARDLVNVNTPEDLRHVESRLSHDEAVHEYDASLRVFSEVRPLASIVALLGVPTHGRDLGGTPSGSMWRLESGAPRAATLDEHLARLVGFAEAHRDAIAELRADCTVDVFSGVRASGLIPRHFTLGPGLLRRLADLDLAVSIDTW